MLASHAPDPQADLSAILEELHDEVYVYDTQTLRLIFANKSARQRCDWTETDVTGKFIFDSSEIFDVDGFHTYVAPLRTGQAEAVTIETVHEKGLVEVTTRLLPNVLGRQAFVSVLRDREHRRQLETARAQAFSEIVHDLRTPLTSIMGALKLMSSGAMGDLPPQASHLLGIIERNADTLQHIVGDILDLQKIATGKDTPQEKMEPVELVGLLKEALAAHFGYCSVHNVEIDLVATPDVAWVDGVPLRLHQILANLLSNAIKNSPAKSKVEVDLSGHGDAWRIQISNEGPGIPEHLRDKIFQNYVHEDARPNAKVKGTGLGLAICKKIVKSHGGEIGFSCDTVGITVFYVDLPKRDHASQ